MYNVQSILLCTYLYLYKYTYLDILLIEVTNEVKYAKKKVDLNI